MERLTWMPSENGDFCPADRDYLILNIRIGETYATIMTFL